MKTRQYLYVAYKKNGEWRNNPLTMQEAHIIKKILKEVKPDDGIVSVSLEETHEAHYKSMFGL
jgi:hypothetical protein